MSKTASTPIPPRAGTVTVSSRARRRSDFNRLVESMCCSNVPLLTSAWRHRHQHVLASRPRNHRVSAASPLSTCCCRCRLNAGNCGLKLPPPPFFEGNGPANSGCRISCSRRPAAGSISCDPTEWLHRRRETTVPHTPPPRPGAPAGTLCPDSPESAAGNQRSSGHLRAAT